MAAGLDSYTAALDRADAPRLGDIVMYSIYEGRVRREDLERWFIELGLDAALLPPAIRAIDAFEQVTGARGVGRSYFLDAHGPQPTGTGRARQTPARERGQALQITLMWRPVRRDASHVVRHLIREVRDAANDQLSYSQIAECEFTRDTHAGAPRGAGTFALTPNPGALHTLDTNERALVHQLLAEVEDTYRLRCHFYTGDRLRTLVHDYVEHLEAIKVRPTGGVYFVHRIHSAELARLRVLVSRLGSQSQLTRVPLPDEDEMRSMIEDAFANQAKDELDRLARDIAQARDNGASDKAVQTLIKRFTALKESTGQHAQRLSLTLDDTKAALRTVNLQLASLLTRH